MGGGVRLRSPTPIEGISRKSLTGRSLSGAEWERLWTLGESLNSMGGGVRLRSPTPDRGHLKEIIKRVFPERLALSEVEVSRMGTLLGSLNPCSYGSPVYFGVC
jgi:hypothetical protein